MPCLLRLPKADFRAFASRDRGIFLHVWMRRCTYVFMCVLISVGVCLCVYVGAFARIASGLAGTSSGLGCSVLSGHQRRGGTHTGVFCHHVSLSMLPFLFLSLSLSPFMPDISWRAARCLDTKKSQKKWRRIHDDFCFPSDVLISPCSPPKCDLACPVETPQCSRPFTKAVAWGYVWTADKINAIVLASEAAISLQAGPQTKAKETGQSSTLLQKQVCPYCICSKG